VESDEKEKDDDDDGNDGDNDDDDDRDDDNDEKDNGGTDMPEREEHRMEEKTPTPEEISQTNDPKTTTSALANFFSRMIGHVGYVPFIVVGSCLCLLCFIADDFVVS
jgi:hypothetical protein